MPKIIAIFAFLATTLFAKSVCANVGVFAGYGHTIELTETKDVAMISEEVTIIPGRGRFLFDGTIPGMNRVEYVCQFKLRNLSNEKVSIQVGFPLNSQFFSPPYSNTRETSDLIVEYDFIAQEKGKIYNVEYFPTDRSERLKNIFSWTIEFEANEEKDLVVTYSLPISMGLSSTAISNDLSYQKDWYKQLEMAFLELFGYVTETGKSWSGVIEKAEFEVYIQGFEDYLNNRPLSEKVDDEGKDNLMQMFKVWNPLFWRQTTWNDWSEDEQGFLRKTYENYEPETNLEFNYYILSFFPKNIAEATLLLKNLAKNNFQKDDYEDLRDIFREYNGETTGNQRIQEFLKNQKWYQEEKQHKIPDEVIELINEYIDNYERQN
ncbi:hypothetical protein [Oscillatoria salina]|uniref:hypothetical protein n=1 Tax=Oscillatoria salina TaxID=331517 RepID=UPI0013B97578|nr:hypothetical protein [Oscillatoria salina]MBZ8180746.1 hypothetical protein [Oscillatoria salina IIICB1]NET91088.1 hypothetical protein [Kamptonema sp. SIO1D9]